jgi:glycosyltransferase involved in cell wall biosynthesis
MIRLTDITFYANSEYADTNQLLAAQQASLLYIDAIKNKLQAEVVKHITGNTTTIIEKENIHFFVSKNKPGFIPGETISYLKKSKPDIVFVHGLIFPLHIIRLAWILGKKVKIVVWHHADRPQGLVKKILQRLANRYISRYLFTSAANAEEWLNAGIIAGRRKIFEVPSTLTVFSRQDKEQSKRQLQIGDGQHYLWIGRLDPVKDPITVINGFEKFLLTAPSAKLHMIYQSGELLSIIHDLLERKTWLKDHILLHGKVPHEALEIWYSAADFLISGSRREAGSVVLLEAMACGCIPIVTAIPASVKVIDHGNYGLFYAVGNIDELAAVLASSAVMDKEEFSRKTESHFEKEYSVRAVADKLYALCRALTGK